MQNKQKIKELALIYLVAIIVLLGSIAVFTSSDPTITGFAILNESNETIINETQSDESIVVDTVINESINETQTIVENETKEKGKPEKTEKPEPNQPPVWKSDVNEFIINGKTIIDLNNYFSDKNNDVIGYAATASEPEKISFEIAGSLITITPAGDNFNSSITIAASDGDKSTTKEVKLIVPERTIIIDLEYKSGSIYDADNDGRVATTDIVDLTVEETNFNWDVNEDNLCTRWDTYSVDDQESTIVCYGSSRCCQFVDLLATRPVWDEPFHSAYGTYGATSNNVISAQVLYVDYELAVEDPFAEIYNSEWSDLSASYFFEFYNFHNVCVDTCTLTGFNDTSYTLIFEIEGATIELDTLTYTLVETIDNVLVNLAVEDSQGITSGTYTLLKDNVIITDEFVEPDYYDLEIIPEQDIIEKLSIYDVNITEPLTADIGIDDVSRQQEIKDVEIIKQYAIDTSEIEFETAILTATATANSLFKCKQWDYSTEVCFGTWEKIKDLTVGEEYSIAITSDDPGFVEGNLLINITPVNITEVVLIKNISDISIAKNNNYTIDLSQYFSNLDSNVVFTHSGIGNMNIVFENNIATIIPDKDYIGIGFTFITADKDSISVSSNIFRITVTNVTIDITPKITSKKKHFKFDEDIEIDFEYLEKQELIEHGKWKEEYEVYEEITDKTEAELELLREKIKEEEKLLSEAEKAIKKQKKKFIKETETIETFVKDYKDDLVDIDVEIEELREGKFKIKLPKKRAFRAGKYTLKLELIKDGITYTQEQNFTWGVLAINVNKSIYLENEDSFIGIAVLDDQGHMVCNASVTLEITSPLNNKEVLSTENGSIAISPECDVYGVTNLPDYYTNYSVSGVGNYIMNLTAVTYNGVRSIQDNFSVQSSVDFDVARQGPTRIFPPVPYNMSFTINANKNYNGVISEFVPATFNITPQASLIVTTVNDIKILSWNVNLKKGDTASLYYEFDAPEISPFLFLLGKLQIGSWQEFRNWQIASDPPASFDSIALGLPTANQNIETTGSLTMQCDVTLGTGNAITVDVFLRLSDEGDTLCEASDTLIPEAADATIVSGVDTTQQVSGSDGVFSVSTTINGENVGGPFVLCCTGKKGGTTHTSPETITVEVTGAAADTVPPFFATDSINNSAPKINEVVGIGQNVSDVSDTISMVIFAHDQSGTMVNTTINTSIIDTKSINFTPNITITAAKGTVIEYRFWANETNGNVNTTDATDVRTFTVANTPPETPTVLIPGDNQFFNSKPIQLNVTFPADADGDAITINYYIDGKLNDSTAFNTTFNGSDGSYLLNVSLDDTEPESSANATTINFTLDTVIPIVNTTLNISLTNIGLGDIINITANITDNIGLSFCQIIINQSGFNEIVNISLNGATSAQCSNKTKIVVNGGSVINFTIRVNDTAGNFRMNDTIITIADKINPVVNTTLNKSLTSIFQNDIINITANVTDNIGLSFCQIIINQSGFKEIINISLNGATSAQCSNKTKVILAPGGVINYTIRVNDTSNRFTTNDTIITVTALPSLSVNISSPKNDTEITANTTFTLIVNVTCLNADCGTVEGLARFNDSGSSVPNKSINTTQFATPLFINGSGGAGKFRSAAYTGFNFSVNSEEREPRSSYYNGTHFYIVGTDKDRVFEYNRSGNYTGFNFSVASEDIAPNDIYFNGTHFFIIGNQKDRVFEYNRSGNYTGFNFSVQSEEATPTGLHFNGTHFFIIGNQKDRVFEYNRSGNYTGFNFSVNSEEATPTGLNFNGTHFFIIGNQKNRVFEYNRSGNYTGFSFSVQSEETLPNAIYFNGSHFYVVGTDKDRVFEYKLNFTETNPSNSLSCGSMSQGDKCQLNFTINASGDVGTHLVIDVNFSSSDSSVVANDTEDHLIKIVAPPDTINPVVNTTLNKSLTSIFQNDIINITANVTDNIGLSFCQIIINQSGFNEIVNISLNGATSAQCSNKTKVILAPGGVINYTIRVNDTSNRFTTNDTIITVQSAANPPVIKLNNVTVGFQVDPVAGGSAFILISFNVTDAQGVTTINGSKAIVNLTLDSGDDGQFRFNISDDETSNIEPGTCYNHTQGTVMIINCTIEMRYYDNASASWVINVSVEDTAGGVGRNDTISFTYNSLSSFSLTANHPGEAANLNFTSLFSGDVDKPAKAPILLNNTGNDDFDQINITAADLISGSNTIAVTNFAVNITNNTAGNGQALALTPLTIRSPGAGLDNASLLHGPGISGDTVPYTGPTDTKGNISLYFWIDVPAGLATGTYNNTWNITVIDLP